MPDSKRKMTEKEFAVEVGVSERTVRRKRHDREIQYHRAGWRVYYLPEDIEAWHETMKHEPIFQSKNLRRA
jgi:excisionase family DNA binding protein